MSPLKAAVGGLVLAALAQYGALAQNSGAAKSEITIAQPWSRATAPVQKTGVVYLRIDNAGAQPDRLVGVESDVADAAQLHTMLHEGGVMKMRPLKNGIEVPANGHVALIPGGDHIMLIGLHGPLAKGSTIPLTLIFDHAGRIAVHAVVEAAGARGPMMGAGRGAAHGIHGGHDAPAGSGR